MFDRIRSYFQKRYLSVNQLKSFVYGPPVTAGVAVSEEIALGITAVYRAVDVISTTIAGLDAEVRRPVPGKGKVAQPNHNVSLLIKDPCDEMNAFKFWRSYIMNCVCAGNSFAHIERDTDDVAVGLHRIHWRNVRVDVKDDEVIYTLLREGKEIRSQDMLHLTMLSWDGIVGISPIRAARESLGISIAAERMAATVFTSGVPRGILKVAGVPNPETKANIREAWDIIHGGLENSNKVAIFGADTEWIETNMSPEDQQLLLSRSFQISEVSRIFGVPVNLLFSGEQSSYNSNEESNIQFYQLGLKSLLDNLESEMDHKLLSLDERMRGMQVSYRVDTLLTGLFTLRANAWRPLVLSGIAQVNEARERLGLNPVPGGDVLLTPVNVSVTTGIDGTEKTIAGLPAAPGELALPAPDEVNISSTALTGIQISSLLEIIAQIQSGVLPLESAKGVLLVAFPFMTPDQLDIILSNLSPGSLPAEPPPQDSPPAPAPPPPDLQDSVRTALLDQVGRALRRQGKSKTDPRPYLLEALEPCHRAYRQSTGNDTHLSEWVNRWMDYTQANDLTQVTPDQILALLD